MGIIASALFSEPDPRKDWKDGLGDGLKCTVHPECRCTSNWFMITFLRAYIRTQQQYAAIVQGDVGSAGERSCWSTAELSLGPRTARSSRNKAGMN